MVDPVDHVAQRRWRSLRPVRLGQLLDWLRGLRLLLLGLQLLHRLLLCELLRNLLLLLLLLLLRLLLLLHLNLLHLLLLLLLLLLALLDMLLLLLLQLLNGRPLLVLNRPCLEHEVDVRLRIRHGKPLLRGLHSL